MNPKSQSNITAERISRHMQARFNPLRSLSPELLSTRLDEFRRGTFRYSAELFDVIASRDDTLRAVMPKRLGSIGRHGWEIVKHAAFEDDVSADKHVEILSDFWNNIRVGHAIKRNLTSGWNTLCAQMLTAIGYEYAAHELVWAVVGGQLRCRFVFVPLWFFEAEHGDLRFLATEGAARGVELDEHGWMVTCSHLPPLMEAAAVNFMYKSLSLKDWVGFSENFGFPLVHGTTSAAYGSAEWNAAATALANFLNDSSMLTDTGTAVTFHESAGKGPDVFQALIDRMDRGMVTLWRGSDLGTMSSQDGAGASLQGGETDLVEQDDALLIEETVEAVSRFVIAWHYGKGTEPMAYLKVLTGAKQDDTQDRTTYETAARLGVKIAVSDFRERFNLPTPAEDETEFLTSGSPAPAFGTFAANAAADPVETLVTAGQQDILSALAKGNTQVVEALQAVFSGPEDTFPARLKAFRDKLPDMLTISDDLVTAFEAVYGPALLTGAEEAVKQTA